MKNILYATRTGLKMSEYEELCAQSLYGKDAKPILIADKSIAGLIAGNGCRKTKLSAWSIFGGLKAVLP